MVYKPTIPQATDKIKVSAGEIRENFTQINTVFGINHESFGTANAGKHKFVQMPEQVADVITGVDEGALYTKQGTYSLLTELFYRLESNGDVINLSQGASNILNGYAYIGRSLIKWGVTTAAPATAVTSAAPFTVSFPVTGVDNIPVFNTVPFVITENTNDQNVAIVFATIGNATTTGFDIIKIATPAPYVIPFIAIGT